MLDQTVFNFARPYAVTRRLEHIVRTALVPEVTIGVAGSEVTGAAPVASELVGGGCGLFPIAQKENRVGVTVHIKAVQSHVTRYTHRALAALLIDHRHTVPRVGAAHAAGLGGPTHAIRGVTIHGAVAHDVIHLSLAEHLIDRHAELVLAISKYRVAHRLTCAHDGLEFQLKLRCRMRVGLHHGFQGCWKQERVGHAVLLHQTKRQIRRKPPCPRHDGSPEIQAR